MPFVKVNYKKIHYRDEPPADGSNPRETFILVHGLGSSQNYYAAVTPHLTAEGYRCVCLDTTGSGRSPYTGIEQSIQSLSKDIVDVMDALSIDKAVVVGHSMAGFTVPNLAAEFPDRVSAIALLGPVYPTSDVTPTFEGRIEAVSEKGMQAMADTVPQAAVGSKAQHIHRAFIREILMGQDPDGYISMCRVIAYAYQNPPNYGKVQCPMLIFAGEEDKSAPVAGAEKIRDQVGSKEKKLVVHPGIGHWMAVECPELVAKEIISFFKAIQ